MGICSLPLIFARKYDIMKNSDERQGGSIFGQKFWFNAVGKKVEYLWMYYKIWLVILAVVIGVIYLGCTMYKGRHTTVLLNVAVTGGDSQKAEELNKDFCKYAGIDERTGSSGYRRIFRKMEGACPQRQR